MQRRWKRVESISLEYYLLGGQQSDSKDDGEEGKKGQMQSSTITMRKEVSIKRQVRGKQGCILITEPTIFRQYSSYKLKNSRSTNPLKIYKPNTHKSHNFHPFPNPQPSTSYLLFNNHKLILMDQSNKQSWTSFSKCASSIFQQDFVHQRLAAFNITKASPLSFFSLKEEISQKEGKTVFRNEVSVQLPFRQSHLLKAVLGPNNYKVQYEHEQFKYEEMMVKFYGSIQGTRTLKDHLFKVGMENKYEGQTLNWRLRLRIDEPSIVIYKKMEGTSGQHSYGFVNVYDILKSTWKYSAFQLGWTDHLANHWYVRSKSGSKFDRADIRSFLQNVSIDYIHNYDQSTTLGLQLRTSLFPFQLLNTAVLWQHASQSQPNSAFKAKVDINRNIALSIKNNIQLYGNYILGVHISDFGRGNRLSFGLQFNLDL